MARHLPSLNALRAFEAAGRLGRMGEAAVELHVTHSAVSRQVQHLEDVLGVALFEGPKNRLRLTDAGKTLLPDLTSALDQIDKAIRVVADTGSGPLDVSCVGTFTMRWLIPRLHRFQSRHGEIEVRMSSSERPVDFSRDGFDVAIRVGSDNWPADADTVPLFAEQFGPVLAPHLVRVTPTDLAGLPVLHTRTRPQAWESWRALSGISFNPGQSSEYERFYFMLEAATSGLGVCIAPWPLVCDDIRAGRLSAPYGFIDSGLQYVALKRARRHRKATLFCEWLQEEAEMFCARAPAQP